MSKTEQHPMQNYLSASHISTNLDDYEAARSGFFTLMVGSLAIFNADKYGAKADAKESTDSINKLPKATGEGYIQDNAQDLLMLNVLKTSVPHFSLEVLEYVRGNETIRFAGKPSFEAGSLVVDDVVGLDTKNILLAWQAQAYNVHTGKGGRMKDYKKTCTLVEYTQDYEPIRQWELSGCWISELSEDDFDRESDGKRQITATLQYDKAIPQEKQTTTE